MIQRIVSIASAAALLMSAYEIAENQESVMSRIIGALACIAVAVVVLLARFSVEQRKRCEVDQGDERVSYAPSSIPPADYRCWKCGLPYGDIGAAMECENWGHLRVARSHRGKQSA